MLSGVKLLQRITKGLRLFRRSTLLVHLFRKFLRLLQQSSQEVWPTWTRFSLNGSTWHWTPRMEAHQSQSTRSSGTMELVMVCSANLLQSQIWQPWNTPRQVWWKEHFTNSRSKRKTSTDMGHSQQVPNQSLQQVSPTSHTTYNWYQQTQRRSLSLGQRQSMVDIQSQVTISTGIQAQLDSPLLWLILQV